MEDGTAGLVAESPTLRWRRAGLDPGSRIGPRNRSREAMFWPSVPARARPRPPSPRGLHETMVLESPELPYDTHRRNIALPAGKSSYDFPGVSGGRELVQGPLVGRFTDGLGAVAPGHRTVAGRRVDVQWGSRGKE